jgi:hypothetical protein
VWRFFAYTRGKRNIAISAGLEQTLPAVNGLAYLCCSTEQKKMGNKKLAMKHYRLDIEKGKITDCSEVDGIGEGYEHDLEGDLYYIQDTYGNTVSIICESNSSAWARKIAYEFLDTM